MNRETLNALLMDRALEALPSDTEMLLDAYLEQNPEAAAELEQVCEVVGLAKQVLKSEHPVSLPEFRIPLQIRRQKQRRYLSQAIGMAASLMMGLWIGHKVLITPPAPMPLTAVIEEAKPIQGNKHSGIWSMAPERHRKTSVRPSRWKWTSPIQKPKYLNQGDFS